MIYTFKRCCLNRYIGQTSRHLETRIKEHIPKCMREHIKNQPKTISIATSNAMKRSQYPKFKLKISFVEKL